MSPRSRRWRLARAPSTGPKTPRRMKSLARRAARLMDEELFNGAYYEQRVQWGPARHLVRRKDGGVTPDSNEMLRLQKAEGPKYQYGPGCLSDGVIGAWMARIYGVETPLNGENVRGTLRSIFAHNFKADLSDHACPSAPATRWVTNPACCFARGRAAPSRRCRSCTATRRGRASSTRSPRI